MRYSTIYGSLAVIPIFLIWLYITWIIVLVGLEVVFTHQYFFTLLRSRVISGGPEGDRVGTGLRLFALVAQRFEKGEDPPTCDQLSRWLWFPWPRLKRGSSGCKRSVCSGVWRSAATPRGSSRRDPERVMVSEVIQAFQPQLMDLGPSRPIEESVNELMSEFLDAGHDRVEDISIHDLLVRADGAT